MKLSTYTLLIGATAAIRVNQDAQPVAEEQQLKCQWQEAIEAVEAAEGIEAVEAREAMCTAMKEEAAKEGGFMSKLKSLKDDVVDLFKKDDKLCMELKTQIDCEAGKASLEEGAEVIGGHETNLTQNASVDANATSDGNATATDANVTLPIESEASVGGEHANETNATNMTLPAEVDLDANATATDANVTAPADAVDADAESTATDANVTLPVVDEGATTGGEEPEVEETLTETDA